MNFNDPTRLICTCFGAAPGSGLDLCGFDPGVRFQDDLFRAANGRWLEATEIPADKPRYGIGENIADVSGLQVAFEAYHRASKGQQASVIDGYTGVQRFFLGWSQAWREKVRKERSLQLLTIDLHAPAEFRANGAAVNHDGFHEAFATEPGTSASASGKCSVAGRSAAGRGAGWSQAGASIRSHQPR